MPTPFPHLHAAHVRATMREHTRYLYRLEQALVRLGHDDGHTYLRHDRAALEAARTLGTSSLYVSAEGGFTAPQGSLTTGPIPPVSRPRD